MEEVWRAYRATKSKVVRAPEETAEHEVEDEAVLILNRDTAQKTLSEEIPEDWEKEAIRVLEETPKVQGREAATQATTAPDMISDSTTESREVHKLYGEDEPYGDLCTEFSMDAWWRAYRATKSKAVHAPEVDTELEETTRVGETTEETTKLEETAEETTKLGETTEETTKLEETAEETTKPEEAVKVLEETPKVLNTAELEEHCAGPSAAGGASSRTSRHGKSIVQGLPPREEPR